MSFIAVGSVPLHATITSVLSLKTYAWAPSTSMYVGGKGLFKNFLIGSRLLIPGLASNNLSGSQ